MWIERILLEDEGDIARRRRFPARVPAIDRNGSPIGALQSRDQTKRRRLAGAGRPEQHHELAASDRKREIAHGFDIAEALADLLELDVRHGARRYAGRCAMRARWFRRTA